MIDSTRTVAIIAGEASGDLNGAHLATALKQMSSGMDICGVGGKHMYEAGVRLLADSSSWSAIGVAEAVRLVPRLLRELRKLCSYFRANPPDVLVLIDFGAFNLRLARRLRDTKCKILYYFPPGSWNKCSTYQCLQGIVDKVVTPFPWSAEALRKKGFDADFYGHPLLDIIRPECLEEEFYEKAGLDADKPLVGLLPGSRLQELSYNLPVLLIAAAKMAAAVPELQFAIPIATSISLNAIAKELKGIPWLDVVVAGNQGEENGRMQVFHIQKNLRVVADAEKFNPPASLVRIHLLAGMSWEVLANARAAVITSGTATVEALIMGCPMVIIYRGSRLTTLEYKLRGRHIKFIGMPNIIADKEICPELIAEAATPSKIFELMLPLISDTPERERMLGDLAKARAVLGSPGAVEKTARAVLQLLSV
jgi:lipid-A-disaccharide synthase